MSSNRHRRGLPWGDREPEQMPILANILTL